MPSIPEEHFDSMNYDEIVINLLKSDNKILSLTTFYADGKISSSGLGDKIENKITN